MPVLATPPIPKVNPVKEWTCKHICGTSYNEYILCTRTRTLGGISPTICMSVVRQLFPYKHFPKRKHKKTPLSKAGKTSSELCSESGEDSDSDKSDSISDTDSSSSNADDGSDAMEIDAETEHSIPKDGNTEARESFWTTAKQRRLNHRLRPLACWEVHREDRFVRSTKCHGVTQKPNQVCAKCKLVTELKGFKNAVYRVRSCFLNK